MHICDRMMYIHKFHHVCTHYTDAYALYLSIDPLRSPAGTRAAVPAPAVPFGLGQVAALRAVGGGSYLPSNCIEKIYYIILYLFIHVFFNVFFDVDSYIDVDLLMFVDVANNKFC